MHTRRQHVQTTQDTCPQTAAPQSVRYVPGGHGRLCCSWSTQRLGTTLRAITENARTPTETLRGRLDCQVPVQRIAERTERDEICISLITSAHESDVGTSTRATSEQHVRKLGLAAQSSVPSEGTERVLPKPRSSGKNPSCPCRAPCRPCSRPNSSRGCHGPPNIRPVCL